MNAKGTEDDVSQELKAFLNYVAGKKSEDRFVKKLEEAVTEAKRNREWRHEYMTLLMRDQENFEKGIEQGKIYGAIAAFKLMNLTEDMILEKLQIDFHLSESEAKRYMENAE